MRWAKRILLAIAVLVTAAILFAAGGIYLYKCAPAWYAPAAMSDEQRAAAARAAEDKMVRTYNWAARTRAGKSVTTKPAAMMVSFTADELTAFLQKWLVLDNASWNQYAADPVVVIRDNRLILAATVKTFGTVVSLHLEPTLDSQGNLHVQSAGIFGGRLPLPGGIWNSQRRTLSAYLQPNMQRWRREARMDAAGSANDAAMAATITQLLLAVLDNRATEPVIFLPVDENKGMPARLTELRLDNSAITVKVQPMSAPERKAFFSRLRLGNAEETAFGR
jgi:hypothetical protein